jgi:hypothetical protein
MNGQSARVDAREAQAPTVELPAMLDTEYRWVLLSAHCRRTGETSRWSTPVANAANGSKARSIDAAAGRHTERIATAGGIQLGRAAMPRAAAGGTCQ